MECDPCLGTILFEASFRSMRVQPVVLKKKKKKVGAGVEDGQILQRQDTKGGCGIIPGPQWPCFFGSGMLEFCLFCDCLLMKGDLRHK